MKPEELQDGKKNSFFALKPVKGLKISKAGSFWYYAIGYPKQKFLSFFN